MEAGHQTHSLWFLRPPWLEPGRRGRDVLRLWEEGGKVLCGGFPGAFLICKRWKEAEKFRASYWGKHWGSQQSESEGSLGECVVRKSWPRGTSEGL